jgi:endophilin-B
MFYKLIFLKFTEEKLGGAEKTVYDANLEVLLRRSDSTKALTERIIGNTTALLQPNPSTIKNFMILL